MQIRLVWREAEGGGWFIDLFDNEGLDLITGIPLRSGRNILEEHAHLGLGALTVSLVVRPAVIRLMTKGFESSVVLDGIMSVLYKRYCRLTIAEGKENTKAIDFSAFRVSFTISQSLKGEPRSANIRIYNVNSETVSRIRQEGQKVILEAGYESNHAIIFQGDLIQRYRTKAESGNDTCLIILASTADQAHSYAVVNASLPAGASPGGCASGDFVGICALWSGKGLCTGTGTDKTGQRKGLVLSGE